MWLHDAPPETACLLRLADVCGATGVFAFALIGVGLCLGGARAGVLLLTRFLYRCRNQLMSWYCKRRRVAAMTSVPGPEFPVANQPNNPSLITPEDEISPPFNLPRLRPRKVGVLELFYPTPPSPRLLASPRQTRSPRVYND